MKKISLSDIRVENVGQKVRIGGILTGISKPKQKIIQISYECHECGTILMTKETAELALYPIGCPCGNQRGFVEINTKKIKEQRILLSGFKVYLRDEKLIKKLSKIKRRAKVMIIGIVYIELRKNNPIGEFVILANEIMDVD